MRRTDDTDLVDSQMNGAAYRAGRTVLDYRMRTFRAFLGLDLAGGDDAEIQDPVACFALWQERAANNRRLLTEVFKCVQFSQANSKYSQANSKCSQV